MILSKVQQQAISLLVVLSKQIKTGNVIVLCTKIDLAEDETEDSYRHGTSCKQYFFANGKFWVDYSCRWNKMIRESDRFHEENSAQEISPETLLQSSSFQTYDYGFYGKSTSYIKTVKNHGDWLEKAKAIDKFIRLNV